MKIHCFGGLFLSACFVFVSCGFFEPPVPPAQEGDLTPDARAPRAEGVVSPYEGGRADAGQSGASPDPSQFGVVKCAEGNEEEFHIQLFHFIAARVDPNPFIDAQVRINCKNSDDLKGAMFIRGKVFFTDVGVFNPEGDNTALTVSAETSYLGIYIIDTHGRNINITGTNTGAQGIKLGYISSGFDGPFSEDGNITLVFGNSFREVTLAGKVEQDSGSGEYRFSGNFKYKNKSNYQSGHNEPYYEGTIGQFVIRACQFFACAPSSL